MEPDARGKNRTLAFASRTLNHAEDNYSVTHQEALAVVLELTHFRDIILGYLGIVHTDHAAVTELFKGTYRQTSPLVIHHTGVQSNIQILARSRQCGS